MTTTLPAVLAVSGSDSSGGAGMQADLKTMLACGVFGMSTVTAITAQNTMGVTGVENVSPRIVAAQIDAVFADIPPVAVKIGMVSSAAIITAIADRLAAHHARNIVLDPVMVATSGARLIDDDAVTALTERLFPLATLVTPNIPETEVLTGSPIRNQDDMADAARRMTVLFGCAALVKGGHSVEDASDVLTEGDGTVTWFRGARVDNPNTHGTGCTLSSAIAAYLAQGELLPDAIHHAKEYLTGALNAQLDLGHGSGPMDHGWQYR